MNTATRPNPTIAIAQAAGQGTNTRPKNGCKDCVKVGLAILPVVPTLVPIELRGKSAELQALDSRFVAEDLQEHWYVVRSLPIGYLYVLKESDSAWDAYVVDADGMLRMVPTGAQPASPHDVTPMKAACTRAGDNIPAQVIAVDPKKHPTIWMAFSRYRWTPQVLDDYRDDASRRLARMTKVNVTAAANNELGIGKTVPFGARMSATALPGFVADYASTATHTALNKHLVTPIRNRAGQQVALAEKMAHMSRFTPGKSGCSIVLTDPVNNVIELGASRDGYAYRVAQASGLLDADSLRVRTRVMAEMVEAVRAHAEKNPGPWYDKNYGPDRFMKHVDQGAVKAALQDSEAFKEQMRRVDACSADYVAVKNSWAWLALQVWDFDAKDDVSAQDHSAMVADSLRGSGVTKLEKERVWYPVLVDLQASDPHNWFYRSMAALNPDLQAYFDANKQWDKEYEDVPKAMITLVRDITSESAQEIARIHTSIRVKRAANQATADIIESVTSLLLHLRDKNPKAYQKLIRRVTVAMITRADLIAEPVVVKGSYNQLVQMIQRVAAGDVRTVGTAPVSVAPGSVDRGRYLAQKGNLGGKGVTLSQGVDGAVLLDLPSDKGEVRSVGAWVVGKLQTGRMLSREDLARLKLRTVDLTAINPVAQENVWLKNLLARRANQSNVVLSGFAAFLQVVALGNAGKDLFTKPGGIDKIEAGVGISTAVLSALAAGLEIRSAVIALRGGEAAVKTALRTRLVARLAGGANLVEGTWLMFKGRSKLASGDADSGWWTLGSGAFLFAGGVTTIAGGYAVAAAGSLTVPVIGWAVATIILLGLSIYFLVNAFSTDDKNLLPLEYWLDNGSFGKGVLRNVEENLFYDKAAKIAAKPFPTLIEEVREFQRIVFAAAGEISGRTDRNGTGMLSSYNVALPRWIATSHLDIELYGTFDGSSLKKVAHFKFIRGQNKADRIWYADRVFGMTENPRIEVDQAIGTARIKGYVSSLLPGGIAENIEDFFEWVGLAEEKDGRVYLKDIRMTVNYTPDSDGMPSIVQTLNDWSIRSAS